jgi:hypothetical protein
MIGESWQKEDGSARNSDGYVSSGMFFRHGCFFRCIRVVTAPGVQWRR